MTISPFVIAVLKFAFLALLYFFVYRAIHTVVTDIRGPRPPRMARPKGRGKAKPPVIVVVRDRNGKKLESLKLKAPLRIGRDESCEIRPPDEYLSNFHARLYPKNGMWYVEDLGSTNGTYVNRQRLTGPLEVHHGDRVRVGTTELEFRR